MASMDASIANKTPQPERQAARCARTVSFESCSPRSNSPSEYSSDCPTGRYMPLKRRWSKESSCTPPRRWSKREPSRIQITIPRQRLSKRVLKYFGIRWKYNESRDRIIILQNLSAIGLDILIQHTQKLRERKGTVRGSKKKEKKSMPGSGNSTSTSTSNPTKLKACETCDTERENQPQSASTIQFKNMLAQLNLERYFSCLVENGFDDWDTFLDVMDQDLYEMNFDYNDIERLRSVVFSRRGHKVFRLKENYPRTVQD